jgi:hypothetical protein
MYLILAIPERALPLAHKELFLEGPNGQWESFSSSRFCLRLGNAKSWLARLAQILIGQRHVRPFGHKTECRRAREMRKTSSRLEGPTIMPFWREATQNPSYGQGNVLRRLRSKSDHLAFVALRCS